jgi:predicted nucleotidyltransferase
MKIEKDYDEFLRLLNERSVRYCVIGSFALAIHARPRYTKGLDILVDPERTNVERLIEVLRDFGFEGQDLAAADFLDPERIIQLGYEPVRIDLLTSIAGCTFEEIWTNRFRARYGSIEAFFIGKRELIKAKRASGRTQDRADLELLEGKG